VLRPTLRCDGHTAANFCFDSGFEIVACQFILRIC
jgi:hypothetical protein